MIKPTYALSLFFFLIVGCAGPKVIQKPIPFDEERARLSLEYMKVRHDLQQEEPVIDPKMVVVHYTVIPTMEKTYQAFYDNRLPGARAGIASASSLNVSSQYVVDRDGKIYQLLPDTVFARHTIGLNHCAIGIENVADGKDLPLTKAQLSANIALVKQLIRKYDIEYVIGHHEYQRFIGHPLWLETDPDYLTQKSDPGDEFMEAIRSELADYDLKPLPSLETAMAALEKARTLKKIEALRRQLVDDALERRGFVPQISHYIEPDFTQASAYLRQMNPDGRWSDVDYADQDNEWNPLVALDRMLVLTYAYRHPDDPLYQNTELLDGIVRALNYWYTVNPHCRNWYKNDIAKQFYFNVIGLLLQGSIDEELLSKIANDLTPEPTMTGSNKTLLSTSVIYRGVIEKDADRIREGVAGVLEQVQITSKEGIQPDFSFHQHGPFIYNGSYGHNFLRETIWLASVVAGTDFAFAEDQIKILRDYFMEGTRWMLRNDLFDYNVRGRQVGRSSGFGLAAEKIVPQLDRFIMADPKNEALYEEVKERILRKEPQIVAGHRHFWRSDYTAHHRPGYFTSLKMCSERTVGMEMDVNSENLYGYYLPYGLTYIYRRGDEYEEIFPVWDWARLPGVTSPHREIKVKGKSTQETSFVGGVSDGRYGVSVMDLNVQDTRAKKAWFWFDREWAALGAGIQSAHEAPIVTGINQTHLRGEIVVDGKVFHGGQQSLTHPSWVWHDSVAYLFPNDQDVVLKAEEQSGHLQKVFGLGADTTYRTKVFSLWFDHGRRPQTESYAYIVTPAVGLHDALLSTRDSSIQVLMNTTEIQAVAHTDLELTGIAFHAAGECALPENITVRVDHPCLALIDRKKSRLTVCDPTARLETITVKIRKGEGTNIAKKIDLPTGGLAGRSVTVDY
jgi:chondroitin AC lyase